MISTSEELAQLRVEDPLYIIAERLILDSGVPSISLLVRSFGIGYSHSSKLIRAMEDYVIVAGELDRYIAFLQQTSAMPFNLKRIVIGERPHV